MTAPDAAGIEAALAAGLAAHELEWDDGGNWAACSCGHEYAQTFAPDDLDSAHRAHLAAALLPVVTQAQAEAWERGNNDGLTFAAAPQKSLLTNPYRARADESGA